MMITVDTYLAELERLLASADPAVRQELVDGIREELAGLGADEADARLRELGDPAFVAAGVLAEASDAAPASSASAAPEGDAAWYPVLTVVLLTIGGFLVPVLGWVVGLIMLWAATGWRTLHKVAGTVLTLAAPGGLLLLLLPVAVVAVPSEPNPNPLMPPTIPWWVIALVLLVAWIAGWIWLLIVHRARR
jgi:hypothetical protein